jgi:pseudaminic acid cytidylyltransferase
MNTLAVITARGGSKRIPRKNIKPFMGKPMISYAIDAALKCQKFSTVMVSTEDREIADIACQYGASVPFMRSEQTATDLATTADVLKEVLEQYADRGKNFDVISCIYPCVPFLTPEILTNAFVAFETAQANALIPVSRFSCPIQRAMRKDTDGFIEYREPENALKRTQDLEPMYHDTGMFYFVKTESFFRYEQVIVPGTIPFEMKDSAIQDIDTIEDWKLAELKYRLLYNV